MKIFFLIFLTFFYFSAKAQLPTGNYASSGSSFRTNYFLMVERDSVTLFGWETTIANDTIYFKSTCKNSSANSLTFTVFKFTKSKLNQNNFQDFISEPDLSVESFLLHKYLFNFEIVGKKILLAATKDSYDSRADGFEFVQIK